MTSAERLNLNDYGGERSGDAISGSPAGEEGGFGTGSGGPGAQSGRWRASTARKKS